MNNIYKNAKYALGAMAVMLPGLMLAGNIPQYKASKLPVGEEVYSEFSDGTPIPCKWSGGNTVIFPGGVETPNEYEAEGFPLGFDFRFGGRLNDRFVVSNIGDIYLGKGSVHYRGDAFRIGMSPTKLGIGKGDLSYKTTGEPGNRVFTLQFKNAVVNEDRIGDKGTYSLQIRLYEATGRIVIAFKEIETVYSTLFGFDLGLSGWDEQDALQLTSKGLDNKPEVSAKTYSYMLEPDTYIAWDCDDYDNGYMPVFAFMPETDTTAPASAPGNLTVEQSGSTLKVNVKKAEGAAATVVLYSEHPFTDADMPKDGETFLAGEKAVFGNATAVYYGNREEISLTIPEIEAGKKYYVRALSANGYPAYGRANATEVVFTSTQGAPSSLMASADSDRSLTVTCRSEYPVIVAATSEYAGGYQKGYFGVFGRPEANVEVGDELEGGGKVVYAGDAGTFNVECNANELTYLRAWTVNGDIVSATSADTYGVPAPSFPYAPALETYPLGERIEMWETGEDQFVPWMRDYDKSLTLHARTGDNQEVCLTSPALSLDRDSRLTFEYAMETMRPAGSTGDSGNVQLPQGNKPGDFEGTGYLKVLVDGTAYRTIANYGGTMVAIGDGYYDGSSTFEPVEVELPAVGDDKSITIAFSVPTVSSLFLRNIKVEKSGAVAIEERAEEFDSTDRTDSGVYNLFGVRVSDGSLAGLPAGIYIKGGKKIIVKTR